MRKLDGKRVVLKRISTSTHPDEVEIGRFFATEPLASHPKNHCVPLLQVLSIPDDPDNVLLVMPFLRTFDDPPFNTVGEVVDALKQVLEVRCYMVPRTLYIDLYTRDYTLCTSATWRIGSSLSITP